MSEFLLTFLCYYLDVCEKLKILKSCRDLTINVNRSDYSLALEKLHPGTAGND